MNPLFAPSTTDCLATVASRRLWLHAMAASAAAGLAWTSSSANAAGAPSAAAPTPLEIWKDPMCGCCQDWVVHMQSNGFVVKIHDTGNQAVRRRLGLPESLGSCHTALVGTYLVEGHVPAADVRRLLAAKPKALGLTVPGMPVGSPGMDGPAYGGRRDPYQVLLVTRAADQKIATQVFANYR